MEIAEVNPIEFEVVYTLQVFPEVRIVPSDPVIPLFEEVVCICWHEGLEQDHVGNDLERVEEHPGGQKRAHRNHWQDQDQRDYDWPLKKFSQPANIGSVWAYLSC